jgi:uncharacterized membrane protein
MALLQIVVKSQILAGGRGLGTFKSGLQGGVHIVKAEEAESLAGKSLREMVYIILDAASCCQFLKLLCFQVSITLAWTKLEIRSTRPVLWYTTHEKIEIRSFCWLCLTVGIKVISCHSENCNLNSLLV